MKTIAFGHVSLLPSKPQAHFQLAIRATAISTDCVAIVTGLETINYIVSAYSRADSGEVGNDRTVEIGLELTDT